MIQVHPHSPPEPAKHTPAIGHEPDRVSFRAIWISIAAIVIAMVLTHLGVYATLRGPAERNPTPSGLEAAGFQASRDWGGLGGAAREELAQLRQRERSNLETYEWLDPQRTHARIPIRRAMEIIAQRASSDAGAPAPSSTPVSSRGGAP